MSPRLAMLGRRRWGALLLAGVTAGFPGVAAARARVGRHLAAAGRNGSLTSSRDLWATIDACNPPDRHDTIGIRGSMPGGARRHEVMYMRFRVQYLSASGAQWRPMPGAGSQWIRLGEATDAVLQSGRTFAFSLAPGSRAISLRGIVDFSWHLNGQTVAAAVRITEAGHKSFLGADPAGYSSAECVIAG